MTRRQTRHAKASHEGDMPSHDAPSGPRYEGIGKRGDAREAGCLIDASSDLHGTGVGRGRCGRLSLPDPSG